MQTKMTQEKPLQSTYLFRYRDLLANTLEEHRKVITKHGSCWWGWWKRPLEGWRPDVWTALQQQLRRKGARVRILLYDSGSDLVHEAWVIAVKIPTQEGDIPKLDQKEKKLVPTYYAEHPFSRAWLQLDKIENNPFDFLGKYSLQTAPPLPYISETILRKLEGKIIKDGHELRSMDTTIWHVRPSRAGDTQETIYAPSGSVVTEPISANPVALNSNIILHITDPHYSCEPNRDKHVWRLESERGHGTTLVEAVTAAIGDTKKIGLVIVTGDLTFKGMPEEFIEARKGLLRLAGILDLDPSRIVVIPGNHDIQWSINKQYADDDPVTQTPEEAEANYRNFYYDLFGHNADKSLAMGRRYIFPFGGLLDICALNSSSLATGNNFLAGMGRIQEVPFTQVANALGWKENGGSFALRMLAIHHHLAQTEDLEDPKEFYKGFGIAIDAARIQRMAARFGTHLAIHGHKHRVTVWKSNVYELPEHANDKYQLGNLSILGGGSAGSSATEGEKNYFNLLDIKSSGIQLDMFRAVKPSHGGAFSLMTSWTAPFSYDTHSSSIVLGDWNRVNSKKP